MNGLIHFFNFLEAKTNVDNNEKNRDSNFQIIINEMYLYYSLMVIVLKVTKKCSINLIQVRQYHHTKYVLKILNRLIEQ